MFGKGSFRNASLILRIIGGSASRMDVAPVASASPDTSSLRCPDSIHRQTVHSPSWISAAMIGNTRALTQGRLHCANGSS